MMSVDESKAKADFDERIAPKVSQPAGVSKVTTRDFVEISREEGARGVALDAAATGAAIADYLTSKDLP